MKSAKDYLQKTENAVRILFDGVDSYIQILSGIKPPGFVTHTHDESELDAKFAVWIKANASKLAKVREVQQEFLAESFALDTLCGAVLQVANKALELYSSNTVIPTHLSSDVKSGQAKFCVGRSVRSVPLGLIVYAARNQHIHFNDGSLHKLSTRVFELLATAHDYGNGVVDPAFDLSNPLLVSYASNVLSLIEWEDYRKYEEDMRVMLGD